MDDRGGGSFFLAASHVCNESRLGASVRVFAHTFFVVGNRLDPFFVPVLNPLDQLI